MRILILTVASALIYAGAGYAALPPVTIDVERIERLAAQPPDEPQVTRIGPPEDWLFDFGAGRAKAAPRWRADCLIPCLPITDAEKRLLDRAGRTWVDAPAPRATFYVRRVIREELRHQTW